MVGTQPSASGNKRWHLEEGAEGGREENVNAFRRELKRESGYLQEAALALGEIKKKGTHNTDF